MSTIAYDGTTLAADTLCTADGIVVGSVEKVFKIGPLLVATAGSLGPGQAFVDWLRGGAKGNCPDMAGVNDADGQGIVILPCGLIVQWDKYGCDRTRSDRMALGSGRRIALGAMAAGMGAEAAVRLAATLDVHTGGEITALRR